MALYKPGILLRLICIIAMSAALAWSAAAIKPGRAASQSDWVEPIVLTSRNTGKFNIKNETLWYRGEINKNYIGYVKIKYENTSGGVRIASFAKIDIKQGDAYAHATSQYDSLCESGSLMPKKLQFKEVMKANKTYYRIEKDVVFDWRNMKVTVTTGDEMGSHSRSTNIPPDAASANAVLFYAMRSDNLVNNRVYRANLYAYNLERFVSSDIKVLKDKEGDNLYQLIFSVPTSFGTAVDTKQWVGPPDDKNPNGVVYRFEINEVGFHLTFTKTTEAKALNQTGKKKKEKK